MTRSLIIEKYWPLALSVLITAGWQWVLGRPFPTSPDALFGAAATVASIFASFLGIAEAIILSIKGSPSYKVLERLNYTATLFAYIASCVKASTVFAALSIIGFFVVPPLTSTHHIYGHFKQLWIFFGCLSLFTYARIATIFFKLLRQP